MKKPLLIALCGAAILAILWLGRAGKRHLGGSAGVDGSPSAATQAAPTDAPRSVAATPVAPDETVHAPTKAERALMSDGDRLAVLERLGRVPSDADDRDWKLASKTSWWGRPLDPASFWKGKPIWCDRWAMGQAAAHGRLWPPMPYEDPALRDYQDDDRPRGQGYSAEGPGGLGIWESSREGAFWTKFIAEHPKPPEQIRRQEYMAADQIFRLRNLPPGGPALEPNILATAEQATKARLSQGGVPIEAQSEDAMTWEYVLYCRENYQERVNQGQNPAQLNAFLSTVYADTNLITQPLTTDQLKAANAWKITYLQRLRREKVDKSYINAYLSAWNLSASEVFGQ